MMPAALPAALGALNLGRFRLSGNREPADPNRVASHLTGLKETSYKNLWLPGFDSPMANHTNHRSPGKLALFLKESP
jgi:hypothetical protein